jgi:hypothetical protein
MKCYYPWGKAFNQSSERYGRNEGIKVLMEKEGNCEIVTIIGRRSRSD